MKLKAAIVLTLFIPAVLASLERPATRAPVAVEIDKERSWIVAHAQATGHTFDAVVTDYDLDLKIDPETGEFVGGVLSFDFENVETGRDKRDREMRVWLDYDSHPTAEFSVTEIKTLDEEVIVAGELLMHGATREIEFPVNIERTDHGVWITGRTEIDHRDWGLERIRAFLFMTVDPELLIEFEFFVPTLAPETTR